MSRAARYVWVCTGTARRERASHDDRARCNVQRVHGGGNARRAAAAHAYNRKTAQLESMQRK